MALKKKKIAKKKPAGDDQAPDDQVSFEESLGSLETIVEELERGELGLSDAIERYEEGVASLKRCHAELERAERRIELLSGFDAEGNPVTEPFDESSDGGSGPSRAGKRTAKAAKGGGGPRGGVDDSGGLF
ncbi:Exodeoxyribonuclease 7 small subunit [Pseudobythopirellula maris]|uniref:Exodeoxyribonuclease 7 small subunit n=1 Tax=Pseudobythopirellula maris TaxID=2527991 RepID=A0A5C5ZHT2_9BACT|nr:exodeoxyribonuclease VII small subunit [Pseudobythopirellula maris]TWT86914.1 Exodeoxyribonuclease 7 small subunit [Pseudobythopirellula maris]